MAVEKEGKQARKFGILFIACFFLYFLLPAIGDLIITYILQGSFSEFVNLALGEILPVVLVFIAALFFILFLVYLSLFSVDQDEKGIRKELILSGFVFALSLAVLVVLQTSVGKLLTSDVHLGITRAATIFLIATVVTLGIVVVFFVLKRRDAKKGKSS